VQPPGVSDTLLKDYGKGHTATSCQARSPGAGEQSEPVQFSPWSSKSLLREAEYKSLNDHQQARDSDGSGTHQKLK
jgi:hypothetical protein